MARARPHVQCCCDPPCNPPTRTLTVFKRQALKLSTHPNAANHRCCTRCCLWSTPSPHPNPYLSPHPNPSLKAVARGASGSTVELLLERGAGDTRDAHGESALMWSMRAYRVTSVKEPPLLEPLASLHLDMWPSPQLGLLPSLQPSLSTCNPQAQPSCSLPALESGAPQAEWLGQPLHDGSPRAAAEQAPRVVRRGDTGEAPSPPPPPTPTQSPY